MPEKMDGTRISLEPGYIVQEVDGKRTQFAIADMLRAADIPALTYAQIAAIKTLANLVVILVRTLIARGVLDDSFADAAGLDVDLDFLVAAIEAMGGAYDEPDLSGADT